MKKAELLALLGKLLPETVEFELVQNKRNPNTYHGYASYIGQTRQGFTAHGVDCEGTPKFEFRFGMATPKGVKTPAKEKTNIVGDLAAWKQKFA